MLFVCSSTTGGGTHRVLLGKQGTRKASEKVTLPSLSQFTPLLRTLLHWRFSVGNNDRTPPCWQMEKLLMGWSNSRWYSDMLIHHFGSEVFLNIQLNSPWRCSKQDLEHFNCLSDTWTDSSWPNVLTTPTGGGTALQEQSGLNCNHRTRAVQSCISIQYQSKVLDTFSHSIQY